MTMDELINVIGARNSVRQLRYVVGADTNEVERLIVAYVSADVAKKRKSYVDTGAAGKVAEWLTKIQRPMLAISGGFGTGKTTLMKCVAEMMSSMPTVRVESEEGVGSVGKPLECGRTEINYVNAIDVNFRAADNDEVSRLKNCRFLFVDDLGVEEPYTYVFGTKRHVMYEILSDRFEFSRFTVFTTNLTKRDLYAAYGERMASRFSECLSWLQINGNDLRQ